MGHCEEMLPAQRMNGVWVSGFEETSFFPSDRTMPDRNDTRRFRLELEVDRDRVAELAGRKAAGGPDYHAFALILVARRTKYPVSIDCYGGRYYSFVADRVETARYLGVIANPDIPRPNSRPSEPFQRSGEGGRIARMEQQALTGCMKRAQQSD
jgi:hypothetical protein